MFLLIFIVRESQMNQQRFKCILLNICYFKSKTLLKGSFIFGKLTHINDDVNNNNDNNNNIPLQKYAQNLQKYLK